VLDPAGAPSANSPTAPATITIRPAAGPLMVSKDPAKKLTITPPTMAVMSPKIGGKSEAAAIPRDSGNANNATINPEGKSLLQFSTRPFHPSDGSLVVFIK
jgi:hypothetical protein